MNISKKFSSCVRRNELGIQMIPSYLREKIFGDLLKLEKDVPGHLVESSKTHLANHNLWKKKIIKKNGRYVKNKEEDGPMFPIDDLESTIFEMPPLAGKNVEEHFYNIGLEYSKDYKKIADKSINLNVPAMPETWSFEEGWTKYTTNSDGQTVFVESIDYPKEDFLVFDVEVCLNDGNGNYPTLAVALTDKYWYSWCSKRLVIKNGLDEIITASKKEKKYLNVSHLIPLGINKNDKRLLIGHNVGFDRSFIKEQYYLENDLLKFLDTMSMHIAISGLTGYQRALFFSYKTAKKNGANDFDISDKFNKNGHPDPTLWKDTGSLNSLKDVYKFYCKKDLSKEDRDIFLKGNLDEVRNDFQNLMFYCANDVLATLRIFQFIWPAFNKRFPHPVTLAGTLEMSTTYLPINISNWCRYLDEAQGTYDDLEKEVSLSLKQIANDSCAMLKNDKYKNNVWLWDLNWSCQKPRIKKEILKVKKKDKLINEMSQVTNEIEEKSELKNKKKKLKKKISASLKDENLADIENVSIENRNMQKDLEITKIKPQPINENKECFQNKVSFLLPINIELDCCDITNMQLCEKNCQKKECFEKLRTDNAKLRRVQPLMSGYPHWFREFCDHPFGASKIRKETVMNEWEPGPFLISTQMRTIPKLLRLTWNGFALHFDKKEGWGFLVPNDLNCKSSLVDGFPLKEYIKMIKPLRKKKLNDNSILFNDLNSKKSFQTDLNTFSFEEKNDKNIFYDELMPPEEHLSENNMIENKNKGIEMFGCTFYRLPHKDGPNNRVGNPLGKEYLRYLEDGSLKAYSNKTANLALKLSKNLSYWKMSNKRIASQMVCELDFKERDYGALLPRVIVAGTITRRAVEQTWLTASNAYEDRAGSELKAMVQAPKGYKFVGADVDSQELWIASLLGDSNFAKIHGCTALGYMTLQGNKNNGTDMHSKIADLVGINRNEAKILNYGRIYGAGKAFAARFLKLSNPDMSEFEAKKKAETIYRQTKGNKRIIENKFLKNNTNIEETRKNYMFKKKNELISLLKKIKDGEPMMANEYDDKNIQMKSYEEIENMQNQETFNRIWVGGSESHMFNKLEEIAKSDQPATPVLDCLISTSLINEEVRKAFITSIINWVVQSSAVDYLHLMLVSMDYLKNYYKLQGRFCISIHDEVRYLFKEDDKYKAAFALQITNLLTRCMFASKLKMYDLPMSAAFFSSIDIDTVLRKEVNMDCKTPSNPHGLRKGYDILFGESLDINKLLKIKNISTMNNKQNN